MPPGVLLEPRPSRLWFCAVTALYLFLLILVLALDAAWPWPLAPALLLAAMLVRQVRRGRDLRRGAVSALFLGPEACRLRLAEDPGAWCEAVLDRDFLVTPWLVVLNLRPAGRRRVAVVLLPDSVPPESLRRLRILLRAGGVLCGAGARQGHA